jgi:hypothetical protein
MITRRRKIHNLIVLVLLISLVVAEKYGGKDKTVVESNHYSSEELAQTEYNVSNVDVGKPLVFILKKKSSKFNIEENHLQVTFHIQN